MNKITVKLRKKIKNEDLVRGGLGDNKPDSDFDAEQLKNGIEIEMEHTKNRYLFLS